MEWASAIEMLMVQRKTEFKMFKERMPKLVGGEQTLCRAAGPHCVSPTEAVLLGSYVVVSVAKGRKVGI